MVPDGRRRRTAIPAPTSMCTATGRVARRGRLPQRPELRLAVQLAGLQRDADLHHPRMVLVLLDLAQRAGDVVGVDPDGAAEAVAELVVTSQRDTIMSLCAAAIAVPRWRSA